jgi:hypothetical protein
MAINLIIFSLHVATVGVGCPSDQDRPTHGSGDAKTLRTESIVVGDFEFAINRRC